MNLALFELALVFWVGLLVPSLSKGLLALVLFMSYLAWHFYRVRKTISKTYLFLIFLLGLWLAPNSDTTPKSCFPWQNSSARIEVLSAEPKGSNQIGALGRVIEVKNPWDLPIQELEGSLVWVTLPDPRPAHEAPALASLNWKLLGQVKVTATGKLRFKVHQAIPIEKFSPYKSIKLYVLNSSLRWKEYIRSLMNESVKLDHSADSSRSMGKSLLLSMLGVSSPSGATYYILTRLGLLHLTAISGLHFALVTAISSYLLRFLSLRKRIFGSCLASLVFLLLCGPTPSALRAFLMGQIAMVCLLGGRRYEALNALSLTTLFWLFFYPEWSSQIGFVLSVTCTAIVISQSHLIKIESEGASSKIRALFEGFLCMQGAIFFFTAPFLLYWFHSLSWLSIAANILVAPFLAFSFSFSILSIAISVLLPSLGNFLLSWNIYLTDGILKALCHLPHRLDQPWQFELELSELSALLPWFILGFIKLVEVQSSRSAQSKSTSNFP